MLRGAVVYKTLTKREIHAVHSEFEMKANVHGNRFRQVFRCVGNPEHPFCRSMNGSKRSLKHIPRAKGVDTRTELIEFDSKYCSAKLMTLCVVTPFDIDTVPEWAVGNFSRIHNSDSPDPYKEYASILPYLPTHRGRITYIKSRESEAIMEFYWTMPSYLNSHRSKPVEILRSFFEDRTPGSFGAFLEDNYLGSINKLVDKDMSGLGYVLIPVSPTAIGLKQVMRIASSLYEYIHLIRASGLPRWTFEEERFVCVTNALVNIQPIFQRLS